MMHRTVSQKTKVLPKSTLQGPNLEKTRVETIMAVSETRESPRSYRWAKEMLAPAFELESQGPFNYKNHAADARQLAQA